MVILVNKLFSVTINRQRFGSSQSTDLKSRPTRQPNTNESLPVDFTQEFTIMGNVFKLRLIILILI